MWIRMRTTAAGPHFTPMQAGHDYRVIPELAEQLIACGAAFEIPAPKGAKPASPANAPIETAADNSGETAVEVDAAGKPEGSLIEQLTASEDENKNESSEAGSAEEQKAETPKKARRAKKS